MLSISALDAKTPVKPWHGTDFVFQVVKDQSENINKLQSVTQHSYTQVKGEYLKPGNSSVTELQRIFAFRFRIKSFYTCCVPPFY